MTVWYKQGVIGDPKREIRRAIGKVHSLHQKSHEDLFVTSIREGNHSAGSLHPDGEAVDFIRSYTIAAYKEAVGPGYDVLPVTGFEETHVHIEWDPKE